MERTLELIDRFFHTMLMTAQSKNTQRMHSQWTYLLNLLRSNPVAYDRIQAYLNILQSHDTSRKKGKKSQTQHPVAKQMLVSVNKMIRIMESHQSLII